MKKPPKKVTASKLKVTKSGANKKTHSQRLSVQTEDGLNVSLTVRGMSRAAVGTSSAALQDIIISWLEGGL